MRNFVKQWDRSDWPTYIPHVTIGPYPSDQTFSPSQIAFDRISVHWGEDCLTFWLR
jgi:hypothetical protein